MAAQSGYAKIDEIARMGRKPIISRTEIARAFAEESGHQFRPILSAADVATLLNLSIKTIYEWVAKGHFDGAFRKRGKHLLFWRDKLIDIIFNNPNWSTDEE